MNVIYVRPATAEDAEIFYEWQKANPNFDPEAVKYPDSFTLCAFDAEGIKAFMPVQQPQVEPLAFESIAFAPGTSDLQQAATMRSLMQAAVTIGAMKAAVKSGILKKGTRLMQRRCRPRP